MVAFDLISLALFEITHTLSNVYPLEESNRSRDGESRQLPRPFPVLSLMGMPSNGQVSGILMSSRVMVCSNPFARARLFDLDNIFCSKDRRAFLAYWQVVQHELYPGHRPFVAALFFDHSLRGFSKPH